MTIYKDAPQDPNTSTAVLREVIEENVKKYDGNEKFFEDLLADCRKHEAANLATIDDLKGVIEGQRKMINDRNKEIGDLKKQIANMIILHAEKNNADADMKGIKL